MTICLGDETVTQHCRVLDTDAFDILIGTDFLRRNTQVKMLSLRRPYSLHCEFGSGLFSVPLELSGREKSGLRYAAKTNYRTENYQLAHHALENGLAALQVTLDEIQLELFASQQQHIMQLYCSKHLNNAFRFLRKAMGLAYANPPFSLLAKVPTKIAYEGGTVVMCTPDWDCQRARVRDTRTGRPATRSAEHAGREGGNERDTTPGTGPNPPNRPRAPRTHRRGTAAAKAVVAHSATPQPLG